MLMLLLVIALLGYFFQIYCGKKSFSVLWRIVWILLLFILMISEFESPDNVLLSAVFLGANLTGHAYHTMRRPMYYISTRQVVVCVVLVVTVFVVLLWCSVAYYPNSYLAQIYFRGFCYANWVLFICAVGGSVVHGIWVFIWPWIRRVIWWSLKFDLMVLGLIVVALYYTWQLVVWVCKYVWGFMMRVYTDPVVWHYTSLVLGFILGNVIFFFVFTCCWPPYWLSEWWEDHEDWFYDNSPPWLFKLLFGVEDPMKPLHDVNKMFDFYEGCWGE